MSYNLAASIASGLRLDMPHTCGAEMKELVTSCWYKHAEDRPKFAVIALRVEDLFEQAQRLVPDSEPHTLESKEKQMEKLKQKIDAKGSIGLDGYERIHSTGYVAADHVVQGNSPGMSNVGA
ncbi:hypothetical protein SARC_16469 [Sphaeroforma arctica JP610]|uniref:Serine-threonine/tyrosine-protein kinase catalytic domain-containing protein n=1 Tax=Sphaeroforma arctica JP610 TaxID=667725 RepID=A0A0L0F2Z9_9EUKA|nr:hypothetical protein SARC_16469 [Sphaeroforma arctica JP610]KNC70999.1 hypothetical protein SARC_16469 [Sphaeroforma arctica JP610]|eukprot:XP_014144901.1 hypothetical protein SARC_16469 [Sphaeroforma arctica JP610]